jgi:hypothetical protein
MNDLQSLRVRRPALKVAALKKAAPVPSRKLAVSKSEAISSARQSQNLFHTELLVSRRALQRGKPKMPVRRNR